MASVRHASTGVRCRPFIGTKPPIAVARSRTRTARARMPRTPTECHLQPRGDLDRRLLPRPVHHPARALVESPNRRYRQAEVALDRLERPWQLPQEFRLRELTG